MRGADKGPGFFISFEGGDGAGKSTQIRILAERLRTAGRDVVVTREPGGSEGAETIRALLVTGDKDRWSPMTEALLMYAARRDHLEKTILPALARGAVVITDRFADSTMAYQGYAGDIGVETVAALHRIVVGGHDPDLTIILNASAEDGLRRADASGGETRFEEKGLGFQDAVRNGFLKIAENAPDRCAVIDASASIEDVAARVETVVRGKFPALFGG